ncbi:hypothetical protein BC937DRAFT_87349, partial [Endogone sp. FLAS-F59071]
FFVLCNISHNLPPPTKQLFYDNKSPPLAIFPTSPTQPTNPPTHQPTQTMPRPSPPKRRRIIAVNFDNTLTTTLSSLVQFHNAVYGTHLKESDFTSENYWEVWGGTPEETYAKTRLFYESKYFRQIQPVQDGTLETLKMLKKRKFTLVIITSRQQFIAEQTKKFVDRYFPGIFDSIYFCNHSLSEVEKRTYVSKPKSVICHEIGAELLIDDSLKHSLECAAAGIKVLLFDLNGRYGWNKLSKNSNDVATANDAALPNSIRRVLNWNDVAKMFPRPSSPLKNVYLPEPPEKEEQDEVEDKFEDVRTEDGKDFAEGSITRAFGSDCRDSDNGSVHSTESQEEMLVDDDDLDDSSEDTDSETLRDMEFDYERTNEKQLFGSVDEHFNMSPLDTSSHHSEQTMLLA